MKERNKKIKKNRQEPSKEEAELAMSAIKLIQEKGDVDLIQKKEKEEEERRRRELEAIEALKIKIAQEQVKRKLRENLKKKEKETKKNNVINFLESSSIKNSKIKWKSVNGGQLLRGYVEDELFFEIKKGISIFSLYVKNKELMEVKKIKSSYISCSTNITKLKQKSDKLI